MATTKKRAEGGSEKPVKAAGGAGTKKRAAGAVKRAAGPRIRASHAGVAEAPAEGKPRRRAPRAAGADRPIPADRPRARDLPPRSAPAARKTPLGAPKRASKRPAPPPAPEASAEARELALALAAAGLDKKAIGIEILEVTGRVDYADYLVIMTGRSDRHVHAIATGIEEAMRRKKAAPLSIEGLTAATWVLIDFGDVVVHVFQEDARRLYDIEGLWIDASRVPVPESEGAGERPPGAATVTRVLPG
ncbi:MAG: ribosome silencing factor [Polyangiaceae bacterium]|nr:ribosome silencing factor [Polyangiaceae bacterium]